jgi:hypothetical protein
VKHDAPPATDLLRALDASVRRESALSGLSGTIAIGVRDGQGEAWWRASFGRHVDTARLTERPARADVTLLVGADEAQAILGLRALPAVAQVEVAGDARLLRRFLDRYLRQTTALSLRASAAPRTTLRRRATRS